MRAAMPVSRWVGSVDEVGGRIWDAVAAGVGFYSSAAWLATYESSQAASVRYLLVEDKLGTLLGALPVYNVHHESNERYSPVALGIAGHCGEVRVLGSRRGYRSGVLVAPALTEDMRQAVFDCVRNELRMLAQSSGAQMHWAYVSDEQLPDVMACGGGRALAVDTEVSLDIPSTGFEGYAAALHTRRRQKVRAERRRFLQAGYVVDIEKLASIVDEAAPLLAQLEAKYGGENDSVYYGYYLKGLARSHNPARVVTCRDNGRLVGCCVFFIFAETLWARVAGFDYGALRGVFEYFNIAFYELLEFGARAGARSIHLGVGSGEAKLFHGGRAAQLWTVPFLPGETPEPC